MHTIERIGASSNFGLWLGRSTLLGVIACAGFNRRLVKMLRAFSSTFRDGLMLLILLGAELDMQMEHQTKLWSG